MVLGCTEVDWWVTRDTGGGLLGVLGRKREFCMVLQCPAMPFFPRATSGTSSSCLYTGPETKNETSE